MRAIASVALLLCLLLSAGPARALAGFGVGVDLGVTVPMGDWAEVSGMGMGGLLYAAFNLAPAFKPTIRVGYFHGLSKESALGDLSISQAPILAGIKWYMLPAMPVYLAGEFGMVMHKATVAGADSDWEREFGATVGAGFSFLSFDARAGFFMPDLSNIEEMTGMLVTLGYRF